jgi:L-arabinose isomerase
MRGKLVERRKPRTATVGILGVGHHTYWSQFPGLREELLQYLAVFEEQVRAGAPHPRRARGREGAVETVSFGMVDDAESAYGALKRIKAANLDLLFCDMLTYATSSTWGILVREIGIPIVLVALQPLRALDYERATTYMQLANDNICSLPEFTGVAVRMGKRPPPAIIGTLREDPEAQAEIADWCDVAKVLHDLRGARIGHLGHVLESMLDMHSDPTAFTAHFGLHVVQTEPDDVLRHWRTVTEAEAKAKEKEILGFFDTPDPKGDPVTRKVTEADLRVAARAAVALDKFIAEKRLDGLAYYYEAEEGTEMRQLVSSFIVGNSMLTAAGFPMCSESDLKTCVAMLILDRLDMGGSFAEFHPIDFEEGFILVGHDGPHHINVAEGRPVLRSLTKYHGKPGSGASVEFKLREGPISMLGITQTYEGRFKFVIAEGESVRGAIPATGNTNTRGYFRPDAKTFLKRWIAEGPTHHFALGVGHRAQTIKKVSDALGIESVTVTPDL